jgi:hypothetical protein
MNIAMTASFKAKNYKFALMNKEIYILILSSIKFKNGRLQGCIETWLSHFKNYLVACDGDLGPDINHFIATDLSDWHSCPPKLFNGIQKVCANDLGCKWLFICDDDTFVNYLNLISFCDTLDLSSNKLYGKDMTGHYPFKNRQLKFLSGGAGTLMPMRLAKTIIKKIKSTGWMEWLVRPSAIPPRHNQEEFPINGVADSILDCITYHRIYRRSAGILEEIIRNKNE